VHSGMADAADPAGKSGLPATGGFFGPIKSSIQQYETIYLRHLKLRCGAGCVSSFSMLSVITVAAIALRLAVSPFINEHMSPQHLGLWEYGNSAASLLAGHGFSSPWDTVYQPSAVIPPVFPLIVAVIFHFFGVRTAASILAVHAFDCVVSGLACIPVFLMARRSLGERAAWCAAWGWAFSPYGIYFAATSPWPTHFLLLCLCWLLYLAQDLERSSRLGLWAGFGLLAGIGGLTEPSILVVVPFLMVLACWRLCVLRRRRLLPGVVASLVLAAAISPWMIRNALVFHRFIPMRDSMGLELWMGNNGQNLRWTSSDLSPLHNPEERASYDRGELAFMDHKMQQAKKYIRDHPAWYAGMCARRAVYLWTGYWSFNHDYLEQEPMDLANIPFSTSLTLLAISGLVLAWRERPFEAIRYAGVLFLFPLMYCFTHPEAYYMRPLDPIVGMLDCYAILALRDRIKIKAVRWASVQAPSAAVELPAAEEVMMD
jgi:4-amino-4-deoxy-L-arabinose transferase-like glycosyltransferase